SAAGARPRCTRRPPPYRPCRRCHPYRPCRRCHRCRPSRRRRRCHRRRRSLRCPACPRCRPCRCRHRGIRPRRRRRRARTGRSSPGSKSACSSQISFGCWTLVARDCYRSAFRRKAARMAMVSDWMQRARKVGLLVLDVDGVLTDGGLYYGPEGEALKRFDVKDGHGIVLCRDVGLPTAILTARSSKAVEVRARELRIPWVLQGERDKKAGLDKLLSLCGLEAHELAYIGDDLNDLPVLTRVGFSAAPADA